LVPVKALRKGAGERCQHQRHTGCAIYAKRPIDCAIWTCRWLSNDDTADLRRPDRSHYVIDLVPDFIQIESEGVKNDIPVIQVWLDSAYPDAHEDPALRAYLERRAREGYVALVRTGAHEAFTIFAPPMVSDHQWHVVMHGTEAPEHTTEEIVAKLAALGRMG
jgi:hypothetical protein